MVRLLLHRHLERQAKCVVFQSHNGAIAARQGSEAARLQLESFNPTMVRLLPSGMRM